MEMKFMPARNVLSCSLSASSISICLMLLGGCTSDSEEPAPEIVTLNRIWKLESGEDLGEKIVLEPGESYDIILELAPAEKLPEEYQGEPVSDPIGWPIGLVCYPSGESRKAPEAAHIGTLPLDYPLGVHVASLGRIGPPGTRGKAPKVNHEFPEDVIPHWTVFHAPIPEPGAYTIDIITFPSYRKTSGTTWTPGKPMLLKQLRLTVKQQSPTNETKDAG